MDNEKTSNSSPLSGVEAERLAGVSGGEIILTNKYTCPHCHREIYPRPELGTRLPCPFCGEPLWSFPIPETESRMVFPFPPPKP